MKYGAEWEPPTCPALNWWPPPSSNVQHIGGPDRLADADEADPNWKPRPAGFTAKIRTPVDPLTWEGDNA